MTDRLLDLLTDFGIWLAGVVERLGFWLFVTGWLMGLSLLVTSGCRAKGGPLPYGYKPEAITPGKYEVIFGGSPKETLDLRKDGKVWYRDQWAKWKVHYTRDNFPVLTLQWRGTDWAYRDLGYDAHKEYRLLPDGRWWKGSTEFSKERIQIRRLP
jgi:hypothetical protein